MEMQQIRYYVALAETLNFTRAAEQCNVSQPALTRAIQQLEYELGGPLVRRERRHSHLTELGHKMLPLLRQCYDSAVSAKTLATAVKKGEQSCLALGVANSLDVALLLGSLGELWRQMPGMQLKLKRGDAEQIAEMLKSGEIEMAISDPLPDQWERLDTYPMFTEAFDYIVSAERNVVQDNEDGIDIEVIQASQLLVHRGALTGRDEEARLTRAGIDMVKAHQIDSCRDLEILVLANMGVGVAPSSALQSKALHHIPCANLDLKRQIAVYTVAGRRRTREAGLLLNLLRSADWSELEAA
jgi:DNA-binding transcriptional LysR family regulator